MEVVLDVFKTGRNPNLKQDLANRKLKKGAVSYEFEVCLNDGYEIGHYVQKFLGPIHEMLKGNQDYIDNNIVLFSDVIGKNSKLEEVAVLGVLFSNINDWDALPDSMVFKHGRNRLTVKNYTKG